MSAPDYADRIAAQQVDECERLTRALEVLRWQIADARAHKKLDRERVTVNSADIEALIDGIDTLLPAGIRKGYALGLGVNS